MCNACAFLCCASDSFDGCGCDCPETDCLLERCSLCGDRFAPALGETCECYEAEGDY